MISKTILFDGMLLRVPVINGFRWSDWDGSSCETYPTYCGAGKGIGDLIVPDRLLGLKISPVCHIHDVCWTIAEPTDEDRNFSDKMFLDNMQTIIKSKPGSWWQKAARHMMAMFYYVCVNNQKNEIFWETKHEQGTWP